MARWKFQYLDGDEPDAVVLKQGEVEAHDMEKALDEVSVMHNTPDAAKLIVTRIAEKS